MQSSDRVLTPGSSALDSWEAGERGQSIPE